MKYVHTHKPILAPRLQDHKSVHCGGVNFFQQWKNGPFPWGRLRPAFQFFCPAKNDPEKYLNRFLVKK